MDANHDIGEIGLASITKKLRRFTEPIVFVSLSPEASAQLEDPDNRANLARRLISLGVTSELTILFSQKVLLPSSTDGLPAEWCFVDPARAKRIRQEKTSHGKLMMLLEGVPRSALSPYQDFYAASGSMFFGRTHVLRSLFESAPESVAIYGPRSVGKTSVVRHYCQNWGRPDASSSIRSKFARHIVYINCIRSWGGIGEVGIWQEILSQLHLKESDETYRRSRSAGTQIELPPFEYLDRLLDREYRHATIVLDEIDNIIQEDCASPAWPLFSRLRALTIGSDGKPRARVIMVGFRYLYGALNTDTFPFYQRAKRIPIPPLEPDACEKLIRDPMRELGIQIRSEKDVLARLRQETGGLPAIMQRLCSKLVVCAGQGDCEITPSMVADVLRETDHLDDILGRFDEYMPPLERLAVLFAAEKGELDVEEFVEYVATESGVRPTMSAVRMALDRTTLACFLSVHRLHKRYDFTVPAVRSRLRDRLSGDREKELTPVLEEFRRVTQHD